jgi:hypothetical protein
MVAIRTDLREITESNRYRKRYNSLKYHSNNLVFVFDNIDLSKANPIWNRTEYLGPFLDWLHSNNVDTSNFQICSFDNYGFGLKATKNLAVISSMKYFC